MSSRFKNPLSSSTKSHSLKWCNEDAGSFPFVPSNMLDSLIFLPATVHERFKVRTGCSHRTTESGKWECYYVTWPHSARPGVFPWPLDSWQYEGVVQRNKRARDFPSRMRRYTVLHTGVAVVQKPRVSTSGRLLWASFWIAWCRDVPCPSSHEAPAAAALLLLLPSKQTSWGHQSVAISWTFFGHGLCAGTVLNTWHGLHLQVFSRSLITLCLV